MRKVNPLLRKQASIPDPSTIDPVGQLLLQREEVDRVLANAVGSLHGFETMPGRLVPCIGVPEPEIDLGRVDLDMELQAEVWPDRERLERALRAAGQGLRACRQVECLVMPVKDLLCRIGPEPCQAERRIDAIDAMPANFRLRRGADACAEHPRQQLPSQAVAEQRHVLAQRLLDQAAGIADAAQIVVDAHLAAEQSQRAETVDAIGEARAGRGHAQFAGDAVPLQPGTKVRRRIVVHELQNQNGFRHGTKRVREAGVALIMPRRTDRMRRHRQNAHFVSGGQPAA